MIANAYSKTRLTSWLAAGFIGLTITLALSAPGAAAAAPPACVGRAATIIGTERADTIFGTREKDVILALGGNDTIYGQGGNDLICGGEGNDKIFSVSGGSLVFGEAGEDTLYGSAGADTLNGGPGDDTLYGGDGADTLNGNEGDDSLNGGNDADTLNGGAGVDNLNGGNGPDLLNGGDAGDILSGNEGDDTLNGNNGDDVLNGDDGRDQLDGDAGDDVVRGGSQADGLRGGGGNDVLYGDVGDDTLNGDDGNDLMDGGAGKDLIYGGPGADTMLGGPEDDTLEGGPEADVITGGAGEDTLEWLQPGADVVIDLGAQDTVRLAPEFVCARRKPLSLGLPLFNDTGVNAVRTTLRHLVCPGDTLALISANEVGRYDGEWVNAAAAALHRELPEARLVALTSGLSNISLAAATAQPPVEYIGYIYEPNWANMPEFDWSFARTMRNMDKVIALAHARGLKSFTKPTGRPLLQNYLYKYGWDYGEIGRRMDGMAVQAQTYCKDGPYRYAEAMEKLVKEYRRAGVAYTWYAQIAIHDGANAVSVAQGVACAIEAQQRGAPGVFIWWSADAPQDLAQFLRALRD